MEPVGDRRDSSLQLELQAKEKKNYGEEKRPTGFVFSPTQNSWCILSDKGMSFHHQTHLKSNRNEYQLGVILQSAVTLLVQKKNPKMPCGPVTSYLLQNDDEARSRWQSVGYHHIHWQESQAQTLVEQVQRGKQQAVHPGVPVTTRLALGPQVEQGEGNEQHGQKHANPRAHHQGELSKCVDQQVKIQHQSKTTGTSVRASLRQRSKFG